jgi:CubicO group peptidase (beta-lactamase class C family)
VSPEQSSPVPLDHESKAVRPYAARLAPFLGVAALFLSCKTPRRDQPAAADTVADDAASAVCSTPSNVFVEAVDALLCDAAATGAFSGSVVIVDGGKQVLAKGYGMADRAVRRRNAPNTIFRIGSLSRQFVATAILALAEDGRLSLTDPISKFLPEYPRENLARDGVEVTLHHLLAGMSGLPNPATTGFFKLNVWRRPIAPAQQVNAVKGFPLVTTPGTAFAYLNYDYLLLALVVERASEQPYGSFLRTRFFEPLGMKDTSTFVSAKDSGREALGYSKDGGELRVVAEAPTFHDRQLTFAFGWGQISSTVEDIARWDRALAGESVLPAAKRNLLFAPNRGHNAYGWVVETREGVTLQWHDGAISPFGFASLMVRVPAKDRLVAYLANMDLALTLLLEAKVEALAVK